jgi:3-deoxy-D-manno-octulosonate 8-phosphate phosphatase (KDO 8-P phosphatase)
MPPADMSYSHLNDYPADIRERAARVRLACFDVDGTLTDGRLFFDSEGRELKAFHVHDGQGLVLLRKSGIAVAFVTARASAVAEQRGKDLGIVEVHTAVADKLACVRDIAARLGIGMEAVAFMGDDLPDLRVMQQVGFSVAPANAHRWVGERVHWRTGLRAGHGAAREFCDLLLAAQGHAEALLSDVCRIEGARVEGKA